MSISNIEQSVSDLKANGGLQSTDAYPAGFQATELPHIAGDGKASMTGNNQAFFFVKNNNAKGESNPDKLELDTTKLKELITNVMENDTKFTFKIDADAFISPDKFVEKYQSLRPEEKQEDREAILRKEVELIRGFIADLGVEMLISEILGEKSPDGSVVVNEISKTRNENFMVEGIKTDKALEAAVWDVEGKFGAKQNYSQSTENTERKWQLGTQPEIDSLKSQGNDVASSIAAAVEEAREMKTIKLTSKHTINEAIRQSAKEQSQGRSA